MKYLLPSLFILFLYSCASKKQDDAQIKRNKILLERFLNLEIKTILDESPESNIGSQLILKDSTIAIQVAEAILFNKYGKKQIKKQKPYSVFLIKDSYWVIEGMSSKYTKDSAFFIILDARDSKVLKVKYGK